MSKIYWSLLVERQVQEPPVNSVLDVAESAGRMDGFSALWEKAEPYEREILSDLFLDLKLSPLELEASKRGHSRLRFPYSRVDVARNEISLMFKNISKDPNDTLIMLDDDHLMPPDILDRLTRWGDDKGVVGALAFRRGLPFFPCMFLRDKDDGALHIVGEWSKDLQPVSVVGTGAIAIKRWVFDELDEAGYAWPYFRYLYPTTSNVHPSEDIYFSECCEKIGLQVYCDCTFDIPHMYAGFVNEESWKEIQADYPDMNTPGFNWDEVVGRAQLKDTMLSKKEAVSDGN